MTEHRCLAAGSSGQCEGESGHSGFHRSGNELAREGATYWDEAPMAPLTALRDVFLETIRLFRKDPVGMTSVVLRRILNGREDAQERLRKITGT